MNELRVVKSTKFSDLDDAEGYCFKLRTRDRGLAAMGPNCIQIYDHSSLVSKRTLAATFGSLTDLAFLPSSDAVLHSSTSKGVVTVWDLRTSETVFSLKSTARSLFSTASSENLIAAGSKTNIHFWDSRTRKPLAEICNMHTGLYIGELHFHPNFRNTKLVSVGEDGVVNTFDLQVQDVDDSLEDSISLANASAKTGFVGASNQFFYSIPVISPQLELYSTAGSEDFEGKTFGFRQEFAVDYLVNCWFDESTSRVRITAGHMSGRMRVLELSEDLTISEPLRTVGTASHLDQLRDVIWLGRDTVISCAEDARICVWKTNVSEAKDGVALSPVSSRLSKEKRTSPY